MLIRTMSELGGTFREDTLANSWVYGDIPVSEVHCWTTYAQNFSVHDGGVYPDDTYCGPHADILGQALRIGVEPFLEEDFDRLWQSMDDDAEIEDYRWEDDKDEEAMTVEDCAKDDQPYEDPEEWLVERYPEYFDCDDPIGAHTNNPQVTVIKPQCRPKNSWDYFASARFVLKRKRCRGQKPKYKTLKKGNISLREAGIMQ